MSEVTTSVGKKLNGKVAIITGGASGIGEATARLFANEGARMVVIADIQDQLGQSVAVSIGLNKCTYVHSDVTDENQVRSMVNLTVKNYGHLDIMYSNAAGIINQAKSVMEIDLQAMDRLFAINVRGIVACVKHAARVMVENGVRGGENIVCTASVYACRGRSEYDDYTMSKHAVLGLVRSASSELGKYGIRVNCVCPGPVATPLMLNATGIADKETAEKKYSSFGKLKGSVLKVDHVANAVLFLASDQSAFVTGHNLVVDGGFLASAL